jgi:hypothetical protein
MNDISLKIEELTLLFNAFEAPFYDEKALETVRNKYVNYHIANKSKLLGLHREYLIQTGEVLSPYPANEVNLQSEFMKLRREQKW